MRRGGSHGRRSLPSLALAAALAAAPVAGCGDADRAGDLSLDPISKKPAPQLPVEWNRWTVDDWLSAWRAGGRTLRFDALWAIGEMRVINPETTAVLREGIHPGQDADLRLAALAAVARWGGAAPPDLADEVVAAFGGPRTALQPAAVVAAGLLGEAVVEPLREALRDEDAAVRHRALRALAFLGEPGAPRATEVARLAAQDPDRTVRVLAARTLPRLGPEGVTAALPLLQGEELNVVDAVHAALVGAGESALPILRAALPGAADDLANPILQVLADLGPAAAPALPELLAALRRPGQGRFAAADALVAIGEAAVPGLEEAARGPEDLARLAEDALRRIRDR